MLEAAVADTAGRHAVPKPVTLVAERHFYDPFKNGMAPCRVCRGGEHVGSAVCTSTGCSVRPALRLPNVCVCDEPLRSGTSREVEDLLQDLPCVRAPCPFFEEDRGHNNEGEHKEGHNCDPDSDYDPSMTGIAPLRSRNSRKYLIDSERAPHCLCPAVL